MKPISPTTEIEWSQRKWEYKSVRKHCLQPTSSCVDDVFSASPLSSSTLSADPTFLPLTWLWDANVANFMWWASTFSLSKLLACRQGSCRNCNNCQTYCGGEWRHHHATTIIAPATRIQQSSFSVWQRAPLWHLLLSSSSLLRIEIALNEKLE